MLELRSAVWSALVATRQQRLKAVRSGMDLRTMRSSFLVRPTPQGGGLQAVQEGEEEEAARLSEGMGISAGGTEGSVDAAAGGGQGGGKGVGRSVGMRAAVGVKLHGSASTPNLGAHSQPPAQQAQQHQHQHQHQHQASGDDVLDVQRSEEAVQYLALIFAMYKVRRGAGHCTYTGGGRTTGRGGGALPCFGQATRMRRWRKGRANCS